MVWVLGFPGGRAVGWAVNPGVAAALAIVLLGALGALLLILPPRRHPRAALLAVLGGTFEAGWLLGMQAGLFGVEALPVACRWPFAGGFRSGFCLTLCVILCASVVVLVLRAGARLFLVLSASAFSVLALLAIRNINLFGLVAGFVLTGNLGEWVLELRENDAAGWPKPWRAPGWAVRALLIGVTGLWLAAVVSDRFFRVTGEARRFGLGESPLAYAHDAARFAGQPGLPERALVFDLRQAGVYLFHNGPGRKLYIDGRLEIPSRTTFESYVRLDHMLNRGRPGWADSLRGMENPLVLLDHEDNYGAEATLLADPAWRCIYYDAAASIFLWKGRLGDTTSFPSVDFLARHFRQHAWRAGPLLPSGLAEARGLSFYLGLSLRRKAARAGQRGGSSPSGAPAAGQRPFSCRRCAKIPRARVRPDSGALSLTVAGTCCLI